MNPSNCKCKCDKPYDFRKYLDYKNCKCRKKLVDKLLEECSENTDENEIIRVTLNDYRSVIWILHNIHCITCHYFFNNHRH